MKTSSDTAQTAGKNTLRQWGWGRDLMIDRLPDEVMTFWLIRSLATWWRIQRDRTNRKNKYYKNKYNCMLWQFSFLGIPFLFPFICSSFVLFLFCVRLVELDELYSTRISQAWLKATESFSVSLSHSWHFGVVVSKPEWWSGGPWTKPHKSLHIAKCFVI